MLRRALVLGRDLCMSHHHSQFECKPFIALMRKRKISILITIFNRLNTLTSPHFPIKPHGTYMVTWNGFTQKHHNFLQSRETFLGFTLNSCSFNKTFTSECGTSVLLCCCCCCCFFFVLFFLFEKRIDIS